MLAVGGAAAIEEAVAVMCGVKLIPIMDTLWVLCRYFLRGLWPRMKFFLCPLRLLLGISVEPE